jgi:hypothetical protein
MKPFAFLTLALALCTGCATVPLAPATPAQLVTRAPASDQATIFVARPGVIGFAVLHEVLLNGAPVGALATNTYLQLDVPPGTHTLAVNWGAKVERVQVTLALGQQVYYRVTAVPAALSALDPAAGARAVARSRRAQRLDQ